MTKLEKASHVAVLLSSIILCLAIGLALHRSSASSTPIVGQHISIPGVHWGESKTSIVLAISARCHFCVESTLFYSRLAEHVSHERGSVRLLAVFPETDTEAKHFLDGAKLDIPYVSDVTLLDIGIDATPMILKVDSKGTVEKEWRGKLRAFGEQQVIDATNERGAWLDHFLR